MFTNFALPTTKKIDLLQVDGDMPTDPVSNSDLALSDLLVFDCFISALLVVSIHTRMYDSY